MDENQLSNERVEYTKERPERVRRKRGRKTKRSFTDNFVMITLLTLFLMMTTTLLGSWVNFVPLKSDVWVTAGEYLIFTGIWAGMLLYIRFTKKNRPILTCIGTRPEGNNIRNLLLGLLIGAGLNGFCILLAWLHGDIQMYFASLQVPALLFVFVCVFIQSSAEELVCRCFMYQRLRRSYRNPRVAIVGNAALFAVLHLLNSGVTALAVMNILVVGIFFSLMVYYMDSLWCAMAVHAAWNYTQNIIFGLPNSGAVVPFSIFKLEASTARDSAFYNVGFGIEGTLICDLVLILGCIVLVWWGRRYGKEPYDPWRMSETEPEAETAAE